MRKFIYSTLLVMAINTVAHTQKCIPNPNITKDGFSPAQLDTAYVGIPYNMVLQVKALKDTMVLLFGFPTKAFVDSILVEKIIGLPSSFSYACYNSRCRFVPDTIGCAKLSVTAVSADAGVHPVDIAILIYGRLESGFKASQRDTVRTFWLVVRDLNSVEDLGIGQALVYPNPIKNGKITIQTSGINLPAILELYSPLGQLLGEEPIESSNQHVDVNQFNVPWIFVRLQTSAGKSLWQGKLMLRHD